MPKKLLNILFIFFLTLVFFTPVFSVYATEASLRCTPTTGTYNVGETFTVDFTLDTRGFQIYGADVEANYDQGVIEAQGTTSTAITSVTGWGTPILNTIDTTSGKSGKISLDYGQSQPAFTGSTSIGQLTFKALAAGQAQFNYVFFQQYDNTTPGVAKAWGQRTPPTLSNVLTDVNNCIYVVADSNPVPTTAPATPVPTSPPQVTQLPRMGVVENTIAIITFGFILLGIGIILPNKVH